jgi:hypothetical protein
LAGSALRRFRTWTTADYAVLVETIVLAGLVELALSVLPLAAILRLQERAGSGRSRMDVGAGHSARLSRFAAAPYRALGWRGSCLRESLVLGTLLRRRGLPARVCFGVDRRGLALTAHAWVAVDNAPIGDGPMRFHELSRVRAWSA